MIISSLFTPPPLLTNRHLQTCLGGLANRYQRVPAPLISRHEGSGDDFFEVASWAPSKRSEGRVVLLHGLEGSLRSGYLRSLIGLITGLDRYELELIFMRGCGPSINRLPRSYHSGFTDDLRQHLADGRDPAVLVGFSIGGNVILKYLGEEGEGAGRRVRGAVVVSTPGDLEATAEGIRAMPLYERYFISAFHRKHRQKVACGIASPPFDDFSDISSFYDYDSRYTAPFFGYPSAEAYWRSNSSAQYIHGIRVPCLLVSALDDPFFTPKSFPVRECRDNAWVNLELSERGGHVGFLNRFTGKTHAEQRILSFVQSCCVRSAPLADVDSHRFKQAQDGTVQSQPG